MKKKYLIISLFFILNKVVAQNNAKGIIIDVQTNKPIPFVHIIIPSKKTGTLSDERGHFEMLNFKAGDTLFFSSIGYEEKIAIIRNSNLDTIKLDKKNYQLPEFVVHSSSKSKMIFEDKQKKSNTSFNLHEKSEGLQILRLINVDCADCRPLNVYFFVKDFSKKEAKLRLHFYSMDTKTKLPSKELLNESIVYKTSQKNDWVKIPLGNKDIVIPSNNVFVGIEFLNGDDDLSMGLTDKAENMQTYLKHIGTFWHAADFMKTPKGKYYNLMVKLEVKE